MDSERLDDVAGLIALIGTNSTSHQKVATTQLLFNGGICPDLNS